VVCDAGLNASIFLEVIGMKTGWLGLVLAAALCGSTAMATNINLRVQGPNGEPTVNVAPGGTVSYRVVAELTDNLNEGLALIGFSLDYTGGAIGQQGNPPNSAPMSNFVIPEGITNPAGYGGTLIGGDLIQCGGAQNTIKNTADNAAFPIGTVITGIASPGAPAVVLTGSFTKPAGLGDFQLAVFDVFANVITDGETGEVFWATEAAGVGTVTNLTVSGDVPVTFASSIPAFTARGGPVPAMGTLWRSAGNVLRLTFDRALPGAPAAGQILIQEMLAGNTAGPDLSASFAFTLESGNTVLRIRDGLTATPTSTLLHRKWYVVRNTGGWAGVANFEAQFPSQVGDATGDNRTLQADIAEVNTGISCLTNCGDQNRKDVTGDGRVLQSDIAETNTRISSLPVAKPCGH
jgi:hypothetical protein